MSAGVSGNPSQLILGNALSRLVGGSAGIESEKEVNGWFQKHLGLSYSAVWRKLNPATGSWDERDLVKVASGLGITLEDLLLALSCGGNRLVDANVEVIGSKAYRRVVLGERTCSQPEHGIVAFENAGQWSVVNAAHATHVGQQTFFAVKAMNLTALVGRRYVVAHIDDELMMTQMARDLLMMEDIDAVPFADEDSFLAACTTKKFDAVIVDWGLATTTAERLIREFRGLKHCATTPIVLVTGAVRTDNDAVLDDLKRVSRDHNCRVLTKPVRWRLVAADVRKQIEEDLTLKANV